MLFTKECISLSDEANYHWLMKVLEEFSNRLQDRDKFKILISHIELSIAC